MTSSGAVKLTFVGLIIVAVRQRAWNTPVHEIGTQRKGYLAVPGAVPMFIHHSYGPLMEPSEV
jgi:hypothetical protein